MAGLGESEQIVFKCHCTFSLVYYTNENILRNNKIPAQTGTARLSVEINISFSRKGQTLVVAFGGFRVRPQTLDDFLAAHGEPHGTENGTDPLYYQYDNTGAASDNLANMLRARATSIDSNTDSSGILVVIPIWIRIFAMIDNSDRFQECYYRALALHRLGTYHCASHPFSTTL